MHTQNNECTSDCRREGCPETDGISLYSESHKECEDFCTRIQIGTKRFKIIERIINWFYLRFARPKLSKDAIEIIKII